MKKIKTMAPVHHHVLATILAVGLACLFGLVIYPKIAMPARGATAPKNLVVTLGETEAVASWEEPSDNGGSPITAYSVSYFPDLDSENITSDQVDDRTFRYPISLDSLEPDTDYTVSVSAINTDGPGIYATAGFKTDPAAVHPPGKPEGCSFEAGNQQVVVACSKPTETGGAPIVSYRIYYMGGEIKSFEAIDVVLESENGNLSNKVNSLTNETEYSFYVTAINSADVEGEPTETVTVTPTAGPGGGGDPLEISGEPTVTTTSSTATIHWTTNKEASSIVYYGPTENIKGVSPEQNVTPRVINHETTITGLVRCAKYWFKSESFDADGNSVQSIGGEFTTLGCKGDSSIVVSDIKTVTAVTGAIAEAKVSGKGIEVVAPAALRNGYDIAIEALKLEQDKVAMEISSPTGKNWVGDNAYSLKALEDEVTEVDGNFDNSVEVSIDYTLADLNGLDAGSLKIYHYEDATGWMPLSSCSNDYDSESRTGTVTCYTTSFSVFGLFGSPSSGGGSSGSRPVTSTNNPGAMPIAPSNAPSVTGNFNHDLWYEKIDPDVKRLQMFLNTEGFILASSGNGSAGHETEYFGLLTKNALVRFQNAHSAEILAPLGLSQGTGFFGASTRAFINSMR